MDISYDVTSCAILGFDDNLIDRECLLKAANTIYIAIFFMSDKLVPGSRFQVTGSRFLVPGSLLPDDLRSELILSSLQLVLCPVAAVKRLPVHHHSRNCIF